MDYKDVYQIEKELKDKYEISAEYNDEVDDYYYETTKEVIGVDVKKLFDATYKTHNGFNFSIKKNQTFISEINVIKIINIFSNVFRERFIHAFDEWGEEFKKFARQFYPFDIYKEALDAVTLTVIKIIDEEHLELWIWNNSGQKYKLKFKSIEEYLEAGVQCKFIICWQYFYIDTDAMDFSNPFIKEWVAFSYSEAISRMNDALATMEEYFPEEEWSYQSEELARISKL